MLARPRSDIRESAVMLISIPCEVCVFSETVEESVASEGAVSSVTQPHAPVSSTANNTHSRQAPLQSGDVVLG